MARYLCGDLNDAEIEGFDRRLQNDATLRRQLAQLLLQDVQLFEIGQEQTARQSAAAAPAQARVSWLAIFLGVLRWEPRWAAGISALLAALSLALGAYVFLPSSLRVMEADGSVVIERGSHRQPARRGGRLRAGDRIVLAPHASVTLVYPREVTRFRLTDSARLGVERSRGGKMFSLQAGTLTAAVAPQPKTAPLRVLTDHAELKVVGTQFVLSVTNDAARLEVWSGKVQLTRLADGESVNVVGGQFARAAAGLPLRAEATQGGVLWEAWRGITGSRVEDLTSNPAFPDRPTDRRVLGKLEDLSALGDAYGVRLRGWLHPPRGGDYTFWIAADDEAELWLSRDESPENRQRVCYTPEFTQSREWTRRPEQKSALIHLESGRSYYAEVLMKQAGGVECLAVAWQGPGLSLEIVEQQYLSPLIIQEAIGDAK